MNNIEQTTNTELIREFGSKLDSYIQILAEKLGVAAEYVYPLFVKQQVIEGWVYLLSLIFIIVLTIISSVATYEFNKKDNWDISSPSHCLSILFTVFLLIVSSIGLLITPSEIATKLFNTEYAAIKEIIQLTK